MLIRDQPALERSPGSEPAGRRVDGQMREVLVPFIDKSWRSCRVVEWRRDAGGWWCLLRWGVAGRLVADWYRHDPALMQPLGKPPAGQLDDEPLT